MFHYYNVIKIHCANCNSEIIYFDILISQSILIILYLFKVGNEFIKDKMIIKI